MKGGLDNEESWFEYRQGHEIYFFSKASRSALGQHSLLLPTVASSSVSTAAEAWSWRSALSCAEVKEWSHNSTAPTPSWHAQRRFYHAKWWAELYKEQNDMHLTVKLPNDWPNKFSTSWAVSSTANTYGYSGRLKKNADAKTSWKANAVRVQQALRVYDEWEYIRQLLARALWLHTAYLCFVLTAICM